MREEIEEEEKKQIDLEEAEYQQQKRKEAIAKAKSQLYFQTDRVKGFHVSSYYEHIIIKHLSQFMYVSACATRGSRMLNLLYDI